MAAVWFASRVIANQKLNYKFHLIRLKLEDPLPVFEFQPGQFVVVKVGPSIYRSYSVASHPAKLPYWQIFADVTPGGPGSILLKNLQPGQKIEHSSNRGIFTLQKIGAFYNLMAATGCGIASMIPIIEELLQHRGAKVRLFWGLRYQKDLCLLPWLESLAADPRFNYRVILSKPPASWPGEKGRLTAPFVKMAAAIPFNKLQAYLCGNQSMIKEVRSRLEKMNQTMDRVYSERYY